MSINTLTGYLLLCIDKPTESLEFIQIAERIAFKLIDKFQGHEKPFTSGTHEMNQMNTLEVIGEAGKQEDTVTPQSKNRPEINSFDAVELDNQQQHKFVTTPGSPKSPYSPGAHNNSIGMSSVEDEPFFTGKRSRMSSTLLSNYVLSISLLKNIAKHFTNPEKFQQDFGGYVTEIMKMEKVLYRMGSMDGYA